MDREKCEGETSKCLVRKVGEWREIVGMDEEREGGLRMTIYMFIL